MKDIYVGQSNVAKKVLGIFVGKTNNLPIEYQEVDYIEGTGTQYINCGNILTPTTRMTIDFAFTSLEPPSTSYYIAGYYKYENNERFSIGINNQGTMNLGIGNGYCSISGYDLNRHLGVINGKSATISFDKIDKTATSGTYSSLTSTCEFGILGTYVTESEIRCAKVKIYRITLNSDGLESPIAHDFIPCYRKSDNEAGVYDIIEGQFYSNSGTGTILVGPNCYGKAKEVKNIGIGDENNKVKFIWEKSILPVNYQQVEYIEGTGTQYLDTGVIANVNSLAMQITAAITSNVYSGSDAYLMGFYAADTRFYVIVKNQSDSAKGKVRLGIGTGYATDSAQINTSKHIWKVDMNNLKVYKDGTSIAKDSGSSAFSKITNNTMKIGILCGSDSSGAYSLPKIKAKVYSAKIWKAGTLIHDYYPCYRRSDNVIGLYDIKTDQFLTNVGTGVFGKGSNYKEIL